MILFVPEPFISLSCVTWSCDCDICDRCHASIMLYNLCDLFSKSKIKKGKIKPKIKWEKEK